MEATIANQTSIKKVLSKVGYGTMATLAAALEIPGTIFHGLDKVSEEFNAYMSMETLNKAKGRLGEMKKQGKEYGEEKAEIVKNQ